ncbi:MAG: ATP-binding cassette domain-containing protein [Rubripirellula sp.]|nr:ATP-binding cassette domain-containing protein [Rubripirellula sp.]
MSDPVTESDQPHCDTVCTVRELHHDYGDNAALRGVDFDVLAGQIFALLGPNGSGKTTLFRLLCTLLPIQRGEVRIGGFESGTQPLHVREQIGIVFQSPSLDKKLTVDENIACQGALYGIHGGELQRRRDALLEQLDLTDRRHDRCEVLSGGLKRRVELAKGMLHRPRLLLLDEPSTGLDPAARLNLWTAIRAMADDGIAVLLTTHLLEEADKADRVAIMSQGKLIADGSPHELRSEMGGGIITIVANDVVRAEQMLRDQLGLSPQRLHHQLRLQAESPATLVPALIETLGEEAQSINIGRPSLEDVFIAKTGQAFVA